MSQSVLYPASGMEVKLLVLLFSLVNAPSEFFFLVLVSSLEKENAGNPVVERLEMLSLSLTH